MSCQTLKKLFEKNSLRAGGELNPRCEGCGQILAGYRRNKKTCGDACRQRAYRKRKREAEFLRQYPLMHPKYTEVLRR